MANDKNDAAKLTQKRASDVLRDTDRTSVGVTRILSESAGTLGDVREYEPGDEALVEAGQADWVVAPVHSPESGRRLDTVAEREQTPRGGVEAFPPADGDPFREAEARRKGYVEAHTDEGFAEKLESKRAEASRNRRESGDGDIRDQLAASGLGARSGPAGSDLTEAKLLESAGVDLVDGAEPSDSQPAKKAAPAKSAPDKKV